MKYTASIGFYTLLWCIALNVNAQTCAQKGGVLINNVCWATRNVGTPGTFVTNSSDMGKFYQWNRKVAYPATGSVSNWNRSVPSGTTWESTNSPCPKGWHVPTYDETKTLLDTDRVRRMWTVKNGTYGTNFTDIVSGNSVFLPAAGLRHGYDGTLYLTGTDGRYWSSSTYNDSNSKHFMYNDTDGLMWATGRDIAYSFGFSSDGVGTYDAFRHLGHSVRCVAE